MQGQCEGRGREEGWGMWRCIWVLGGLGWVGAWCVCGRVQHSRSAIRKEFERGWFMTMRCGLERRGQQEACGAFVLSFCVCFKGGGGGTIGAMLAAPLRQAQTESGSTREAETMGRARTVRQQGGTNRETSGGKREVRGEYPPAAGRPSVNGRNAVRLRFSKAHQASNKTHVGGCSKSSGDAPVRWLGSKLCG